jgi:hypothetical protein
LDQEDESDSDSELEDEEDEGESEESEEEESDDERAKQKKRSAIKAYKDPRAGPSAAPKRRTTIIRKKPTVRTPGTPESSQSTTIERRETRDSTKARTLEVTSRSTELFSKSTIHRASPMHKKLTQEELLAEAAITEEWNRADYEAYIRYTELSDKEKAQFLSKGKRTRASRFSHTIVSRSFVDAESKTVSSEIIIHPPPITDEEIKREKLTVPPPKSTLELLGITKNPEIFHKTGYSYRHPVTYEGYNTREEYEGICRRQFEVEKAELNRVIENLKSLLVKE